MPLLTGKHPNASRAFYPSFDGGLNLSVPNESLAQNELKEALNVEFSNLTGSLKVRGGLVWSGSLNQKVSDAVPVYGRNGLLFRIRNSGMMLYFTSNCVWRVSGHLNGSRKISAAPWGDNGAHVVAGGGKLDLFEPISSETGTPSLRLLPTSPNYCNLVFVKDGRIGVVVGSDTLRFSAIGDCNSWENDPDDLSSGQFVEIGYKDGMDITAVVPLSRDLIIFKSPPNEPEKGIIWRLTGNSPSEWQVVEAAHNTGTFSQKSVQAIANDVYYLTPHGLANLSSVTAYGEVKASWPDRKVSSVLSGLLQSTAQLWNMASKQQLWVLPNENTRLIWIFDYMRGIWTQFEFPETPLFGTGILQDTYLVIKNNIYCVNDYYHQDELRDETPQDINAKIRFGTILKGLQTLIKTCFVSFSSYKQHGGDLKLGKFTMALEGGGTPYYIYNNTDIIYGNERGILSDTGVLTARRRCLVRDWAITPRIEAVGGFALSTMGFEIAEV